MKQADGRTSIVRNTEPAFSRQKDESRTPVRGKERKTGIGSQKSMIIIFLLAGMLLIAQSSLLVAQNAPAKSEGKAAASGGEAKAATSGEKTLKPEEMKRGDLTDREEALRREEERLKVLRKELDEKIDKYTKLLAQMEETLKAVETAKGERYEHLIKAYEAMPNEDAAARLATLDEPTAVKIIVRMKSKKAGAVMAAMEPKKAAALTEGMISVAKKFPAK
jgi:flagellar motility protein MotE (MotC chaperone)